MIAKFPVARPTHGIANQAMIEGFAFDLCGQS